MGLLEQVRKLHHGARHHCFAYRLGVEGETVRSSDDGEPAHSAGTPILGALRSREITQTVAVVVRYFGGIKLGVPGLIEAYREATFAALDSATVVERDVLVACTLSFPFDRIGEVMRWVKSAEGVPGAPTYHASRASLHVLFPQAREAEARLHLATLAPFGVVADFTPVAL
jgi:putative IMPACT (imprinted ancient) family translation regulator